MMLAVAVAVLVLATAAAAQVKGPAAPVVMGSPAWKAVPEAPGVHYAPNLGLDVFRFQNNLYCWHQGQWFLGRGASGPWQAVTTLPPVFYQVQAPYFKNPPGWAKGRKTGWGGQPMPPGQMKKMQGGGPPGQMKKMYK
jgi:hypothetical protein